MVSDVPRRFVIFMGYVGQTTCGDPKTNSTERIRCFQVLIIHNIYFCDDGEQDKRRRVHGIKDDFHAFVRRCGYLTLLSLPLLDTLKH